MSSIGWWIVFAVVALVSVAKWMQWRRDRQARKAFEETVRALLFLLAPDDMFPATNGSVKCVRGNAEIDVDLVDFAENWLKPVTDAAAAARCNQYLADLIRAKRPGDEQKLRDELVAVVTGVAPDAELVSEKSGVLVFQAPGGDRVSYQLDHLLIDLWGERSSRARKRLMAEWVERELVSADGEPHAPRAVSSGFGRTRGTSDRGDLTRAPMRLH